MQMESMYSGAERHSTSVQSLNGRTIDSICLLNLALEFQSWFQHKLDLGIISKIDWIETECVQILLYIHVYADGPTLPLWAGRKCSDSASFKHCSRCTLLYNAKAWASHAQQPTCWVVCCSKPPSWWESEGQQLAGIQYYTSIENWAWREGETEKELERAKEKKEAKKAKERAGKRTRGTKGKAEEYREGDRWSKKHTRGNPQAATDWDATTPRTRLCWDDEKQERPIWLEGSSWPE